MIWSVLIIVGGAALGLLLAMIAGVVYTIAVGGIEEDDPRQYVVLVMLMIGILAGLVAGSLIAWLIAG